MIKLALDFPTLDALKALATARKETSDRTAYAILQHVLGVYQDQHQAQQPTQHHEPSSSYNLNTFAAFKPNN